MLKTRKAVPRRRGDLNANGKEWPRMTRMALADDLLGNIRAIRAKAKRPANSKARQTNATTIRTRMEKNGRE
ncbi:MAG: hypothetical protein JNK37_23745 [Verrucomicrobiales bacterium]|nr:hypothetical protein [Verrucomicrobiales bacterium]